jgi:FkbM family methyltransferase
MKRLRNYVKNGAPITVFLFSYNLASILRKNTPMCRMSWRSKKFTVDDGKMRRVVSTRTRALTYYDGFKARADDIAKTYFVDKIHFIDGDIVIDCGANMGDLFLWFNLQGKKIEYHGFEPNPVDFECLTLNCPKTNLYNSGLWKEEGKLSFYVSTEVASSSFIEPPEYTDVIMVSSKRLDSYFKDDKIKLLKLEAEGAEPEVLQGAEGLLSRVEYISADIGPERGPTELSTRDEVIEILSKHHFAIAHESVGARKTILFVNSRI